MKQITLDEFEATIKAQGVPIKHVAFECPMCHTIQSAQDLINAGAGKDLNEVEKYLAFSCIGRFNGAGSHKSGDQPGRGCDWTLGGLFKIHQLEVTTLDGKKHPRFAIASAVQAKANMEKYRAHPQNLD